MLLRAANTAPEGQSAFNCIGDGPDLVSQGTELESSISKLQSESADLCLCFNELLFHFEGYSLPVFGSVSHRKISRVEVEG